MARLVFATALLATLVWLPFGSSASGQDRWSELIDEAGAAFSRQDYPTAERRLHDALYALPAGEEDGRRARDTWHRLGLVHQGRGDAAAAEDALLHALGEGAQDDPLAGDPSARLGYLHTLANLYESIGEWGSAEARRQQIVDVAAREGMTSGSLAVATANVARFYARRGDAELAVQWHERALEILETAGGGSELAAEQYEALAVIHKEAGQLERSAEAYAAALSLWTGLGQPISFVFAKTLAGHAELLWRSGDRDAALDELLAAVELADALLGDDPPAFEGFLGTYVAFLTQLGENTRKDAEL